MRSLTRNITFDELPEITDAGGFEEVRKKCGEYLKKKESWKYGAFVPFRTTEAVRTERWLLDKALFDAEVCAGSRYQRARRG